MPPPLQFSDLPMALRASSANNSRHDKLFSYIKVTATEKHFIFFCVCDFSTYFKMILRKLSKSPVVYGISHSTQICSPTNDVTHKCELNLPKD